MCIVSFSIAMYENVLSSILYRFGQVDNTKAFWDALEIEYNERERNTMHHIGTSEEDFVS
jgi:hypothetical protein